MTRLGTKVGREEDSERLGRRSDRRFSWTGTDMKPPKNVSAVSDAPHCNCVGRLQGAGRVRYSRLKGAARGEASMQIQW